MQKRMHGYTQTALWVPGVLGGTGTWRSLRRSSACFDRSPSRSNCSSTHRRCRLASRFSSWAKVGGRAGKWAGRWTDRRTDGQTDRRTENGAGGRESGQRTDKQTHTQERRQAGGQAGTSGILVLHAHILQWADGANRETGHARHGMLLHRHLYPHLPPFIFHLPPFTFHLLRQAAAIQRSALPRGARAV